MTDHATKLFLSCGSRIGQTTPLILRLGEKAAAQQAQMRAAERAGKRIAVQFAKPSKPWTKR